MKSRIGAGEEGGELKLEMEVVNGWRTGMLGTAIAKVEQPTKMQEEEWRQEARLLYVVRVALKLCPETPGGGTQGYKRLGFYV